MPHADMSASDFTPGYSKEILRRASRNIGLDAGGAVLLRHQTNGVYLLPKASVVAKVSRPDYSVSHIRRVVELAAWLTTLDFPTVRLVGPGQPIVVAGSAVTFWEYLPPQEPIAAADLGAPLRRLHTLPLPPLRDPMPDLDAIAAIKFSLDNETILTADEQAYLVQRWELLAAAMADLRCEGTHGLLHGDPQHGNALRDARGTVLSDWESAVVGPAEWDLVAVETHCRRFGHPQDSYAAFCEAYGRDVREWEGFGVLRDVRELRMIATNARKSRAGSAAALQVKRRIAQLRTAGPQTPWSIL